VRGVERERRNTASRGIQPWPCDFFAFLSRHET
jgi:hypothetical protein